MGDVKSLDRLNARLDTPELPAYQAILCHASAVVNQSLGYPDQALQAYQNGLAHWKLAPESQGLRAASLYFEWLREEGFEEMVRFGEQQYQSGDCPLVDPRLMGASEDPLVACVDALQAEDGTTAERALYSSLQQETPDRGLALSLLGLARYVGGDYAGSREVSEEAASTGLQHTASLVRVALHLQGLGRQAAAAKLAALQVPDPWVDWSQELAAQAPPAEQPEFDWKACMQEGFERLQAGDLECASQDFARAATREQSLRGALALNALALVAFLQGKYGESTENQQEALQLWSEHQNLEDPDYLVFLNLTAAQDIPVDPLINPWGKQESEGEFVEGEGWADDMADGWQALRKRDTLKAGRHFSLAAEVVRGHKQALALASLAATSLEMGDYASADEAYREAGELWKGDATEALGLFCELLKNSGWNALSHLLASEQRLLNPWEDVQAAPADPVMTSPPVEAPSATPPQPEVQTATGKDRKGWWPFKR